MTDDFKQNIKDYDRGFRSLTTTVCKAAQREKERIQQHTLAAVREVLAKIDLYEVDKDNAEWVDDAMADIKQKLKDGDEG